MDMDFIHKLVQQGESGTLEFKESSSEIDRAAQTLCGFLNTNGGIVLIGVSPKGKILGQHISDMTKIDIANILRKFDPHPPIHVEYILVPKTDRKIIVLTADSDLKGRPYTYGGKAYQRIESSTSVMPQTRYQQLLFERNTNAPSWESLPAKGISLENLDGLEIQRTVQIALQEGRLSAPLNSMDPRDILIHLNLIEEGQLLNAAVVLFSKKMLPYYAQCKLQLARFRGINKGAFIDQQEITGHAFLLLDEAIKFIAKHLPRAGRFQDDKFERIDELLFPTPALREALINAICHRDYTVYGGAISIAIYDDRMEIWNDGLLPFGLTVDVLKKAHPSKQRNPLIASVFHHRNLIDRWGRGIQKIIESCIEAGQPEPEFFEQANSFCVKFIPKNYIATSHGYGVPSAQGYNIPPNLTKRQHAILALLRSAGKLALREIVSRLDNPPSSETVGDDLQLLKRAKLIEREGHGRNSVWLISNTQVTGDK